MENKEEIIKEVNIPRSVKTRIFEEGYNKGFEAGVKKGAGDERRFIENVLDRHKKISCVVDGNTFKTIIFKSMKKALQSKII